MTKNVSCICFEYFPNYFLIHIFCVLDVFSLFQRLIDIIFDNFSFSWFVCIDQFSKWKTKCILSEKQFEEKNVLIATCATWDSNCYLFKYYAITKFWPGKNILCFSLRKSYCAGGCNEKKYLAVIHGRDRYHCIWNMKRFKYTLRQWDPNGEHASVVN